MAMTDAPERAVGSARGRWMQIGLLAAAAFAPLMARWQSLREDDRAQALRERAVALRERATLRAAQAAQAARALRRSWRRGGAGVVVDASDARNAGDLGDFASSDDVTSAAHAPLDAPAVADMVAALAPAAPLAEIVGVAMSGGDRRGRALRASFWLAGVSAGLIAAGVVTYIVIRNRQLAREERETYRALAFDALDGEVVSAPTTHAPIQDAPETPTHLPVREPDFATPPTFSAEDEVGAQWVGDIFTRAYAPAREADATGQPAAGRRIFFTTEEDARNAGYHRAGTSPTERE